MKFFHVNILVFLKLSAKSSGSAKKRAFGHSSETRTMGRPGRIRPRFGDVDASNRLHGAVFSNSRIHRYCGNEWNRVFPPWGLHCPRVGPVERRKSVFLRCGHVRLVSRVPDPLRRRRIFPLHAGEWKLQVKMKSN